MMKRNRQRLIAYGGESTYDFEGRKQYNNEILKPETAYKNYVPVDDPDQNSTPPDNTTKILLYLAIGGVVFTGLLIWILGRKKK